MATDALVMDVKGLGRVALNVAFLARLICSSTCWISTSSVGVRTHSVMKLCPLRIDGQFLINLSKVAICF